MQTDGKLLTCDIDEEGREEMYNIFIFSTFLRRIRKDRPADADAGAGGGGGYFRTGILKSAVRNCGENNDLFRRGYGEPTWIAQ